MPLYHDEETIRRVWELRLRHPDWGVRRIGEELGISKDKVHRILKRIERGDIEVTRDGKVIDRSEPKGIVALQRARSRGLLSGAERPASKKPSTRGEVEEALSSDPLEDLLKTPWEIECDRCKRSFTHSFTDEEVKSLEEYGYTYVDCPYCEDRLPGDLLGISSHPHRVFIRMSDLFGAYLRKSKSIRAKSA